MDVNALFDHAKKVLGWTTDVTIADAVGVKRAFICNIRAGRKALPELMKQKLIYMIEQTTGEPYEPLQSMPVVQRQAEHESGVLPGAPSGGTASPAPQPVPDGDQGSAGQGRSQPADLLGELGEVPQARVLRTAKLKRGTRSGTILRIGCTYYPDKPSDHTHRRILGILRRPDKPTAVVYSTGDDHNSVCNRDTFIRWMDPTRYHNGQTEVRLAETSPAPDQPEPAKKTKRVRKASAAAATVTV